LIAYRYINQPYDQNLQWKLGKCSVVRECST